MPARHAGRAGGGGSSKTSTTVQILTQAGADYQVHASQARWGEQAGEAAEKSCQAMLNLHYTLIYSGHFLEKGAKEVDVC